MLNMPQTTVILANNLIHTQYYIIATKHDTKQE